MSRLIEPVVDAGTMANADQPDIHVDGLVLRRWLVTDAPAVVAAFSDPSIQRWHFRRCDSEEDAVRWIRDTHVGWTTETSATWAACDGDSHETLGRITPYPRLGAGHGEISYWVLPKARRRGIATRAVRGVTQWAHHDLGLERVELKHSVGNPSSCRVAAAAGFTVEGTMRRATLHADGWHDMHLHSHLLLDDAG